MIRVRDLLQSVWQEPRPAPGPPRRWLDWLLVGVIVSVTVTEAVLRPDLPGRYWQAVTVASLAPTLLWRRTRPLGMVVIAFGVTALTPVLVGGARPEMYSLAFLLVLLFAVVRWGSGREAVLGSAVVVGKAAVWVGLGLMGFSDVGGGLVVLFAVAASGAALRYRAGARERQLEQVRLRERESLARDLHDTVAHHVSAMAIRAQAGLVTADARPEAATEALRVIEAEAALALAEMRGMVRVLRRGEPADRTPTPTVNDVKRLAASRSPDGPEVEVEVSGDVEGLAPPVGAALFRMAQESVTNARRHARNVGRVEVRVVGADGWVRLSVTDDGGSGASEQAGPLGRPRSVGSMGPADSLDSTGSPLSSGFGLAGMAERAALLGGTLTAGPNPGGGGWTVAAALPRTGPAA